MPKPQMSYGRTGNQCREHRDKKWCKVYCPSCVREVCEQRDDLLAAINNWLKVQSPKHAQELECAMKRHEPKAAIDKAGCEHHWIRESKDYCEHCGITLDDQIKKDRAEKDHA